MSKSREQRRRPQCADGEIRRRHRAPVHDVHRAARAVAGMVRRGRAGGQPFPAAPVEGSARTRGGGRRGAAATNRRRWATARRPRPAPHRAPDAGARSKDDIGTPARVQHGGGRGHGTAERRGAVRRCRSAAARAVRQEALEIAVLCLSPIVPHICHALWQRAGAPGAVAQRWRKADPAALVQDQVEVVVQVNGKLRGRVSVPPEPRRGAARSAHWPTKTCAASSRASRSARSSWCAASSSTWWSDPCARQSR